MQAEILPDGVMIITSQTGAEDFALRTLMKEIPEFPANGNGDIPLITKERVDFQSRFSVRIKPGAWRL